MEHSRTLRGTHLAGVGAGLYLVAELSERLGDDRAQHGVHHRHVLRRAPPKLFSLADPHLAPTLGTFIPGIHVFLAGWAALADGPGIKDKVGE